MSIKEIHYHESFTQKGGTSMKKTSVIIVLAIALVLALATVAMAAPGNYDPAQTSDKYVSGSVYVTTGYTDGAGNVYSQSYEFLNPRANNLGDVRTTVGGWTIFNANYTGELNVPYFQSSATDPTTFNTYQRNVAGQLVHSDFQLNTNSCASCHMTHTAQSRQLLFRNGVYTTCTACHDGTLGFLNVFAAPTTANPYGGSITAGTFGANMSRNASVHLANGLMKLSAAPGGNRANAVTDEDNGAGTWNADFTCGSCHGPHGSYSIRLLHSNPNNISLRKRLAGSSANTGGLWVSGLGLESVTKAGYYKAFQININSWPANNPWYYGYPGGASTGDAGTSYAGRNPRYVTRIYHPSLYDPNTVGGPMAAIDGTKIFNNFFGINFGSAYAYFETLADEDYFFNTYLPQRFPGQETVWADRAAFLAGLKIDVGGVIRITADSNYATPTTADRYKTDFINSTSYKGNVLMGSGSNVAYNVWCAACHTDYLGGFAFTQREGVGVYSKAHRHTINRGATGGGTMKVKADGNNLLCLSCHFAHGADSSFMSLANAQLVDQDPKYAGTNDVNTSSALKRYVNMSVCWSCHANSKSTTMKNSQWYWDSYELDGRKSW
jgi:predicted CXXCH cytochrome family protein